MELAEELRDRVWMDLALRTNANISHLEGDLLATRQFSERALLIAPQSAPSLFYRAQLEFEEGDFAQGDAYLERLMGVWRLTPGSAGNEPASVAMLIPLSARITGVMDRFEEA